MTDRLSEILSEIGVSQIHAAKNGDLRGFPHKIPTQTGEPVWLDLDRPALISALDPELVGFAILDLLGFPTSLWGLARDINHFSDGKTIIETPIAGLLEGGFEGRHGSIYYRGIRYFASHVTEAGIPHIVVLVINAMEESDIRKESVKHLKTAETLRRLGKALIMNQNCEPLSVAASHAICSTVDLAAVLLWVVNSETRSLELMASVGINRQGIGLLQSLSLDASGCFAEVAASTGQSVLVKSVSEHMLSSQLEAGICYLKPQALYVCPLEVSGQLVGVLELVGKAGDRTFVEKEELFETIGEHVALAVNGAIVFENLQKLATLDALTGLHNHRSMQETLHQMVSECERSSDSLSALMLDVDHFHFFNEEEGHDAGDNVLKKVADILKMSTRTSDLVARYGGEEFVVLMPRLGLDEAAAIAERIRLRIAAYAYQSKCGGDLHITASIGVATLSDTGLEASALLRGADAALYAAKKSGRNRVCLFDGHAIAEDRRSNFQIERLKPWFSIQDWEVALRRLEALNSEFQLFASHLHLNASQKSILQGLLVIGPTYRHLFFQRDHVLLERMQRSEEFRLLMPSLSRLEDRFDAVEDRAQSSHRIPLLARILQVLLALESGQDLRADPGLYDPQMVAIALALNTAA